MHRLFSSFLILAVVFASSFAGIPASAAAECTAGQDTQPVSSSNLETISSAAQAVRKLPEAPGVPNPSPSKKPWYQVTVSLNVETPVDKPAVIDTATLLYDSLDNASDPNNAQVSADYATAQNIYKTLACSGPSCGVQTLAQMQAYLQSNQNISLNAKVLLLNMVGTALNGDYNYSIKTATTPLSTVLQALENGTPTAGVCRDIATFLATVASGLGLSNVGTLASDHDFPGDPGGHVIAYFKDPQSGQYIFVNYYNLSSTQSKYLSEAALEQSINMAPLSAATTVETGTGTSSEKIHQMVNPRTQAIMDLIHKSAQGESSQGKDRPLVILSVGTLENSASIQTTTYEGQSSHVGVFALGVENHEEEPVQVYAAGVHADSEAATKLSDTTSLSRQADVETGGLVAHDQAPAGNDWFTGGRTTEGFFLNTQGKAELSNKTGSNEVKAGVEGKESEIFYKNGLGIPYDLISVVASDQPNKNIEIHGASNNLIFGKSMHEFFTPTLHSQDNNVGVKLSRQSADGKLSGTNDFTVHYFGEGAVGLHDVTTATYKTESRGSYSLGADVGANLNSGKDDFNTYPVTCKIVATGDKKIGRVQFQAHAQASCNSHNTFSLMQSDSDISDLSNTGFTTTQPRAAGGINLSF